MKKAYHKLALQFHSEKNKPSHASAVMLMINEAKERLEDLLRYNDAMREQKCVLNGTVCLIPCFYHPQMNRWKHFLITHMIQVQGKN